MAFVLLTVVFFTDHYCAGYLISIVCCPFFISVLFRIVVTSGGWGGGGERERGISISRSVLSHKSNDFCIF